MQFGMVPRKFFLTGGIGRASHELESFEMALRDAGIQAYNLVCVSSILPPGCQKVSIKNGNAMLSPGEIVHCVLAQNRSNEEGREISAALGVASPVVDDEYGYLCEHTDGSPPGESGSVAEFRAARMLATAWGNPADEVRELGQGEWAVGEKRLKTENFSREATVGKGEWCTVLSAVVFIP